MQETTCPSSEFWRYLAGSRLRGDLGVKFQNFRFYAIFTAVLFFPLLFIGEDGDHSYHFKVLALIRNIFWCAILLYWLLAGSLYRNEEMSRRALMAAWGWHIVPIIMFLITPIAQGITSKSISEEIRNPQESLLMANAYIIGSASGFLLGLESLPTALQQIGYQSTNLWLAVIVQGIGIRLGISYLVTQFYSLVDLVAPLYAAIWVISYAIDMINSRRKSDWWQLWLWFFLWLLRVITILIMVLVTIRSIGKEALQVVIQIFYRSYFWPLLRTLYFAWFSSKFTQLAIMALIVPEYEGESLRAEGIEMAPDAEV